MVKMTPKEIAIQCALGTLLPRDCALWIRRTKYIPKKILETLSNTKFWYVRLRVAQHTNTSVKVLAKLSTDSQVSVCAAVARNHNTSQEILAKLSIEGRSDHLKICVAGNTSAHRDTILQLRKSTHDRVRLYANANHGQTL